MSANPALVPKNAAQTRVGTQIPPEKKQIPQEKRKIRQEKKARGGERTLSVIFRTRGELYLLPAASVFKVAERPQINRIPRLPPQILGIAQHRGRVVTVFDLSMLLFPAETDLPAEADPSQQRSEGTQALGQGDAGGPESSAKALGTQQRLIILDHSTRSCALLVDGIEEIKPIRMSLARPGPSPALSMVQHRGSAVHALRLDVLMSLIFALAERDA